MSLARDQADKAADYPDFEQALLGAQSKLDASHILRRGDEASVYAETSRGWVRYDLFRVGDMWHWDRKGPLSPELPKGVEMIPDVLDLGWDPETPIRAVAEARVSDRERWEKLQAEFNRLGDEMTKVESEARVKYGPEGLRYASRALQTKHEKLKASRDRVFDKLFAMTQKLSPRDWSHGVPAWWVAGKLTFDDMVRPQSEPLSVTPPLAYGATTPMKEASEARLPPVVHVHPPQSSNKVVKYVLDRHRRVRGRQEYTVLGLDQNDRLVQVVSGFGPQALLAKAKEIWPNATQEGAEKMGAVREVLESHGREGRRYEYPEWLEFECEPATPTPELKEKAREFKKLALEFLESYARTWSIDTSGLDEDSFVWNAYASIVGHGVGLWEGDGDTGLRGEDEKKIHGAITRSWSSRGANLDRMRSLAHEISDECAMLQGPEGREAREEASIPTKAQLKIISAFRERRLMGNPMRDSISTDGDIIYSYRMPIARRTPNGGIWIADAASAPSATTRNHIYGLQRTFTPAEIAGTRAAEARRRESVTTPHGDQFEVVQYTLPIYWASYLINGDASGLENGEQEKIDAWLEREGNPHFVDVSEDTHFAHRNDATNIGGDVATYTAHVRSGPTTEPMPAPEAPPRLQPGYAFYTPSKRKGDWSKIPNDDWEHVIVDRDEAEKADYVGTRTIDGYPHDIFEIVFAHGRRSKTTGYWAQLQTHTRGRSAAHELHRADDFPSTKDAIHHAQRAWGATHVDFHGTRNTPTVYGMKDGARWKKTLYKEKGKYHWPEKFSRGPKKLRGAIELTPIATTLPPLTPPPKLGPPMQRPPMSPTVPGAPPSPRRDPFLSEEADRRYTTKQSPQEALKDDVFYEGGWIGFVKGPYKRRGKADFFEWELPPLNVPPHHAYPYGFSAKWGESSTRRAALNALIRAHKVRLSGGGTHGMREARENPATDLQDAIPWVRVTRDPERYKEAIARANKIGPVDDARKVYDLVGPALMKEDQETFIVVLIDVRQNCRGVAEIHRGARSRVATSVLDVMRVVIASGAEGFIVVHNHPSGKAMPSDADRSLTKAIERAARPFAGETKFCDHVVCGAGEYFSFADNKLHKARN